MGRERGRPARNRQPSVQRWWAWRCRRYCEAIPWEPTGPVRAFALPRSGTRPTLPAIHIPGAAQDPHPIQIPSRRKQMPDPSQNPSPTTVPSDSALLERVTTGDASALDELLDRYWSQLVSYAVGIVGNPDLAQDVTQEAFVRLWERRESWSGDGSVQALLYRMVRNLALDQQKARTREEARTRQLADGMGPVPSPLEMTATLEFERAFWSALESLSPRRREVYELVRVEGLSYRDVGEILEIAPQTVANHLSAAMAFLRERLSAHIGSDDPASERTHASQGG
ncbi:MAG: sigma-70 family RNA polymerase sigma factor [Gemmatimonadales bacterium]|nr:MAG: sigma-70 family RNA polymerase sigma factor [Gemmatimonadales bacterium]